LDDINYKAFELEHLQKLSIKQKESDAEERRKLDDNIQKAQEDLAELVLTLKIIIILNKKRKKQTLSKLKKN
jgi:hypothetical protein